MGKGGEKVEIIDVNTSLTSSQVVNIHEEKSENKETSVSLN